MVDISEIRVSGRTVFPGQSICIPEQPVAPCCHNTAMPIVCEETRKSLVLTRDHARAPWLHCRDFCCQAGSGEVGRTSDMQGFHLWSDR